ncbi:MAG TPA: hypothetical protein VF881_17905 [Polyangiaceae bacterium]
MRCRIVRIALGLCVLATLLTSPRARADGSERFPFLDEPPPVPAPLPPAPAREADEYPRRAWEGFVHGDLSAPFCRGDALGAGQCGGTGAGTALGGAALDRVSPLVALGLEASFTTFRMDAAGVPGAFSRTSWMGFVVRGYFLDRGALDPYVEAGIGRGAVATGYESSPAPVRADAAGPAAMARAGIDFWIAPFLRLGPALSYRWTWLTDVRACAGTRCETTAVSDRGAVGSDLSLSLQATFAFGREM